jgi:hypothetical protein
MHRSSTIAMLLYLVKILPEHFTIDWSLMISFAGPSIEVSFPHWLTHHFFFLVIFAVLADCLNALAVGAPLLPGLRICSPDPAAMRFFFALIFAYNPGFLVAILFAVPSAKAFIDTRIWISFLFGSCEL